MTPLSNDFTQRPATTDELTQIKLALCINCKEPYHERGGITFAVLSNGRIIWWHTTGLRNDIHCHE